MKPSKLIVDEIEDKEGEEVSFSLIGLFIFNREEVVKEKNQVRIQGFQVLTPSVTSHP